MLLSCFFGGGLVKVLNSACVMLRLLFLPPLLSGAALVAITTCCRVLRVKAAREGILGQSCVNTAAQRSRAGPQSLL